MHIGKVKHNRITNLSFQDGHLLFQDVNLLFQVRILLFQVDKPEKTKLKSNLFGPIALGRFALLKKASCPGGGTKHLIFKNQEFCKNVKIVSNFQI